MTPIDSPYSYYQGYVRFFREEIDAKGVSQTLEEYVFSEKLNTGDETGVLSRFVAALFHALIHIGHGLEFGLEGMLVEGRDIYD